MTSLHRPLLKPWSLGSFGFLSFLPELKSIVGAQWDMTSEAREVFVGAQE